MTLSDLVEKDQFVKPKFPRTKLRVFSRSISSRTECNSLSGENTRPQDASSFPSSERMKGRSIVGELFLSLFR